MRYSIFRKAKKQEAIVAAKKARKLAREKKQRERENAKQNQRQRQNEQKQIRGGKCAQKKYKTIFFKSTPQSRKLVFLIFEEVYYSLKLLSMEFQRNWGR